MCVCFFYCFVEHIETESYECVALICVYAFSLLDLFWMHSILLDSWTKLVNDFWFVDNIGNILSFVSRARSTILITLSPLNSGSINWESHLPKQWKALSAVNIQQSECWGTRAHTKLTVRDNFNSENQILVSTQSKLRPFFWAKKRAKPESVTFWPGRIVCKRKVDTIWWTEVSLFWNVSHVVCLCVCRFNLTWEFFLCDNVMESRM